MSINPKLKEQRGRVENLRKELSKILEQAGPDLDMAKVSCVDGDSQTKVAYFQGVNTELDEAMETLEPLEQEHAALTRAKEKLAHLGQPRNGHPAFPLLDDPSAVGRQVAKQKPIGELVLKGWDDADKTKDHEFELPDVSLKTLFATTAGWAPETIRTGRLVEEVTRPLQVTDVIPDGATSQSSVVYMEETTFTNAAAEVAEGGPIPEAALALTEQSSAVRKIAVFLPVTDEQLEDVPQVQGYLNNRLPFMVRQRLDGQILNGNGTAPNLRGILNVVGIQTQAKGADPTPDAIYKAMTLVRLSGATNGGSIADTTLLHPNDWQEIRLLRTADGIYIFGSPQDSGIERLWGLPVVQAEALPEGTGLVGAFQAHSELAMRRGMEVKISESHSDWFIKDQQAVKASIRVALVVYRPGAFCTVTGI